MTEPQRAPLAKVFEPLPLPRARAYLSLTFGGLALLFLGGVLSYASGSPDLHGRASSYWTVFFTFHTVAFGGAGLLGAFPRLALPRIKAAWGLALAMILALGLGFWWSAAETASGARFWSMVLWYAPALIPVTCGLSWRGQCAGAQA
jgi:hypothetical protein